MLLGDGRNLFSRRYLLIAVEAESGIGYPSDLVLLVETGGDTVNEKTLTTAMS